MSAAKKPGRPYRGDYGQGYKPGHPCHYRGGSVKGHAPTNPGGNPRHEDDPDGKGALLHAYRFDRPLGKQMQSKIGNRPKSKERQCLEAIQNGADDKALVPRFPEGMIRRLRALHEVAEDASHAHFINAQRMVREILHTNSGDRPEGAEGAAAGDVVRLIHGHLEAPLPGAEPEKNPPAPEGASASG